MTDQVTIRINGAPHRVDADLSVAAALLNVGVVAFRHDLGGNPRAVLCAMGTCFECRVAVDGVPNTRACITPVRDGLIVETLG